MIAAPAGIAVTVNPQAADRAATPPWAALSAAGFDAALAEIRTWPGYAPTPLRRLPSLAAALGLSEILYKDEGGRFGLGSFKPLGGAYAVARAIAARLAERGVAPAATAADLAAGRYRAETADFVIASATDGNHGRAVAWGARLFGAQARIYVHEQVSAGRRAAIAAYGAEIVVCPGGYDDSVRRAFADAAQNGWRVVQDTSIGDYRDVPADITHGYGVVAAETIDALDAEGAPPPTHAVVQAGVGGVASAIAAQFWRRWGPGRPRLLTLEPTQAACVAASVAAGARTAVTGDTHSAMAGLACGEVSEIAWEMLAGAVDAAIALDDPFALEGVRRLATPLGQDPAIVGGECAGGGIGALIALADRPALRAALGLGRSSRVFVLGTEGATDPAIYREITGRAPETVAAREA